MEAIRNVVDFAIETYQVRVSPYKGFQCAHRVLHGGQSCSGFARDIARGESMERWPALMRERFAECCAAATILRARDPMPRHIRPVYDSPEFCNNGVGECFGELLAQGLLEAVCHAF